MGLKSNLNKIIEERGEISLNELEEYCHKAHYKLSYAERELRPSASPNIEGVWKNGAIIGYKAKQSQVVADFLRDFPSKPKVTNQLF